MRDSRRGSIQKCSWTPEEDQILTELVRIHGPKKWSLIAHSLRGRIGKQCRERWHNHLNPEVRKDAWSPEEDALIFDLVEKYGTKWATIAKTLVGRTDNAIKNRYYSSLKKHHEQHRRSSLGSETAESIVSKPMIKRRRSLQSTSSDDTYAFENPIEPPSPSFDTQLLMDAVSESSEDHYQFGLSEELGVVEQSPQRLRLTSTASWTHMFSLNGMDSENFSPDTMIASISSNAIYSTLAQTNSMAVASEHVKVPGAGRAFPGQRRLLPLARVHSQTVLKFHEMQSPSHVSFQSSSPMPALWSESQFDPASPVMTQSILKSSLLSDDIAEEPADNKDYGMMTKSGIEPLEQLSLISEYNILLEFS